ncbi:hypothetical protein [Falsirhodobacter sp. 20TX0035]|uniref:hypothetical protein n=1 Tax=Falsirhodobacter sp. 20TX0035 TaxID=3022019 RepID=UPI002330922E|nr:hypothetical protein [Falsirhodobacter sp. 20TX0035]MDB6454740.1 hypothetical protein [Falsirhodobacter sp. 20TX0035]
MISAPPFYRDEFGIGQIRLARIRHDAAEAELAECAPIAFTRGYVPDLVRASARRRFTAARAEHDRAKTILRHMGASQ